GHVNLFRGPVPHYGRGWRLPIDEDLLPGGPVRDVPDGVVRIPGRGRGADVRPAPGRAATRAGAAPGGDHPAGRAVRDDAGRRGDAAVRGAGPSRAPAGDGRAGLRAVAEPAGAGRVPRHRGWPALADRRVPAPARGGLRPWRRTSRSSPDWWVEISAHSTSCTAATRATCTVSSGASS